MQTKSIPFVTQEGYKYVLKFTNEPNHLTYEILSISIDLHEEKTSSLKLKDIFSIGRVFGNFLQQNHNKILTYVCDERPVLRSKQNQKLSPQEYRSKLFETIFRMLNDDTFYKRDVTIGFGNNKQYLSFIGLSENEIIINECASLIIEKLED